MFLGNRVDPATSNNRQCPLKTTTATNIQGIIKCYLRNIVVRAPKIRPITRITNEVSYGVLHLQREEGTNPDTILKSVEMTRSGKIRLLKSRTNQGLGRGSKRLQILLETGYYCVRLKQRDLFNRQPHPYAGFHLNTPPSVGIIPW
jgi:hypothetical protein